MDQLIQYSLSADVVKLQTQQISTHLDIMQAGAVPSSSTTSGWYYI